MELTLYASNRLELSAIVRRRLEVPEAVRVIDVAFVGRSGALGRVEVRALGTHFNPSLIQGSPAMKLMKPGPRYGNDLRLP